MKLRISILLLFVCLIGQAQMDKIDESKPVTINKVTKMAVYPGCEEFKGSNRELIMCFAEKLNNDFFKFFDMKFPTETVMVKGKKIERFIDKETVSVILEFHLDTKGEITGITAKKGDEIIFSKAESALKKVAEDLKQQGKKITPVKMTDGSDVSIIMTLPVRLRNPDYPKA